MGDAISWDTLVCLLQVRALLFEPPPFNPAKLTTAWLPGVTRCVPTWKVCDQAIACTLPGLCRVSVVSVCTAVGCGQFFDSLNISPMTGRLCVRAVPVASGFLRTVQGRLC